MGKEVAEEGVEGGRGVAPIPPFPWDGNRMMIKEEEGREEGHPYRPHGSR